jgi:hypothetical protein
MLMIKNSKFPITFLILFLITFILFTSSIFIKQSEAYSVDSYSYSDSFEEWHGIEASQTRNFINFAGSFEANATEAVLSSKCISLERPQSSTFEGWSFAEIEISNTEDILSNNLNIEDCSGNPLLTIPITDLQSGTNTIDLSSISEESIRVIYSVIHTSSTGNGYIPSRVEKWSLWGKSSGPTTFEVISEVNTVESGSTVTFLLNIASSGVVTKNPYLEIDLESLNGDGISTGTAEDATVCYDKDNSGTPGDTLDECDMYRPLTFISAGNGPMGETPTTPASGAINGNIIWDLEDIPDGNTVSIPVTFSVPNGYIDGKTISLNADFTHGESSNDLSLNNFMTISRNSAPITVTSIVGSYHFYSAYSSVGPGAYNLYDYIINSPGSVSNSSDIEDLTIEIANIGSCQIDFISAPISRNTENTFVIQSPSPGEPITPLDPVIFKIFRSSFEYQSSQLSLYYSSSSSCSNGEQIQNELKAISPSINQTLSIRHNIVFNSCRRASNAYIHRLQSGNSLNPNFSPFPGFTEYYITSNPSIKPGEFYTTWSFYGGEGTRTQTVTLDKTYYTVNMPDNSSFHGIIDFRTSANVSVYKDIDGTAPYPGDPSFDTDFDEYDISKANSPNSSWHLVEKSWNGPFVNPPNATDKDSVVVPNENAKLLIVKYNDDPPWIGNLGNFAPRLLWKVCDGDYCDSPVEGTLEIQNTGRLFTEYDDGSGPVINNCMDFNSGKSITYESKSWPAIYSSTSQSEYPAGKLIDLEVHPHNNNHASIFTDAQWGVNLFNIRESIDFDYIVSKISNPTNKYPAENQNIEGESCNIEDARLVIPDESTCLNANDGSGSECFMYWDIPDSCQLPNGWGYNREGYVSQDSYTDSFDLKFKIPIKNDVEADTLLTLNSEVRTRDLSTLGADNSVELSRWSSSNYSTQSTIKVLATPSLDISQTGSLQVEEGRDFSYNIEAINTGNTLNSGIYLIDQLPKQGINNSDITPIYGQVFSNKHPSDISIYYSNESDCYNQSLSSTWVEMSSVTSTRAGTLSVTDTIPSTAYCILAHLNQASDESLEPHEFIRITIDMTIPMDATRGLLIFNKAKSGASISLNSPINISEVETSLAYTEIGSQVVLDIDKSFEIENAVPGRIKWTLKYSNKSSTNSYNAVLSDTLPGDLIFVDIDEESLDSNVICSTDPCIPSDSNTDGSGGNLIFNIAEILPDDGNEGGNDEGSISFWTDVKEGLSPGYEIENCASISPSENGISGVSCSTVSLSERNPILSVTASPEEGGDPIFIHKSPWGKGKFTISTENDSSIAKYLNIYNEIDPKFEYITGSLVINGSNASDSIISERTLSFNPISPTPPGESLVISFEYTINEFLDSGEVLSNSALLVECEDQTDKQSCSPSKLTNEVSVIVYNEQPEIIDDLYEIEEDNNLIFNPLLNDSDLDGEFRITEEGLSSPVNGTLNFVDGYNLFTYIPDENFNGTENMYYEICDLGNPVKCDSGNVSITIRSVNDHPVLLTETISVDEDSAIDFYVHENDYDVDGYLDLSLLKIITPTLHGDLKLDLSTSLITYQPFLNFDQEDIFTYQICDNEGACTEIDVEINVNGINDPPIAQDDDFIVHGTESVNILVNDIDVDDGIDPDSFRILENPNRGNVVFNNNDGTLQYFPKENLEGNFSDQITYLICDYSGQCDDATVEIFFIDSLVITGQNILYIIGIIFLSISAFCTYLLIKDRKRVL